MQLRSDGRGFSYLLNENDMFFLPGKRGEGTQNPKRFRHLDFVNFARVRNVGVGDVQIGTRRSESAGLTRVGEVVAMIQGVLTVITHRRQRGAKTTIMETMEQTHRTGTFHPL